MILPCAALGCPNRVRAGDRGSSRSRTADGRYCGSCRRKQRGGKPVPRPCWCSKPNEKICPEHGPRLTAKEIGQRINAHLQRFEADPNINVKRHELRVYYHAGAHGQRAHVYVTYVSFQRQSTLKKVDALKYLAWLDAGNVGRHFEALR